MAFYKIKNKEKNFYIYDEHDYPKKEWIKLGGRILTDSKGNERYFFNGVEYKYLNCHEIYSGWCITLVRLPELSYEKLFELLRCTKYESELSGTLGLLLKKYEKRFINDFFFGEYQISKRQRSKCYKQLKFISEYVSEVRDMEELLSLIK